MAVGEVTHQDSSSQPSTTSQNAPSPASELSGLGSARGIRWLLLAGALVAGVSVYRLVEWQWQSFPAALQYLILVSAAFGLYGTGRLLSRRLHLPLAGGALAVLATALVPILACGAAWLNVLATPWGALALVLGTTLSVHIVRGGLASRLDYRGRLLPVVSAVFLIATPVLVEIVRRGWLTAQTTYLLASLSLGALFLLASLYSNRFVFHRDRRDGVDRPLALLPFALLALQYVATLLLLEPVSSFLALPVGLLGLSLVLAGEEYTRALAEANGELPRPWPRRSVGLLSVGLAFVAASVPLSLLDPSLKSLAIVLLAATALFLRLALRYESVVSLAAALISGSLAYHSVPALVPGIAKALWARFLAFAGLASDSLVQVGYGELGLFLLIAGLAWHLRRQGHSGRLLRTAATAAALHLVWLVATALADAFTWGAAAAGVLPFLLITAVLALLGLGLLRRVELLTGAQVPLLAAALVLPLSMGGAELHGPLSWVALAAFCLAILAFGRRVEPWLVTFLGSDRAAVRLALLAPASAAALLTLVVAGGWGCLWLALSVLHSSPGVFEHGMPLSLAAALSAAALAIAAYRARSRVAVAVASALLTVAVHALVWTSFAGITPAQSLLVSLGLLLAWGWGWQLRRRAQDTKGAARLSLLWPALRVVTWLEVTAGAGLLVTAWFLGQVFWAEPLFLLIVAAVLAEDAARQPCRNRLAAGLMVLTSWLPIQLLALDWPPNGLETVAAALALGLLASIGGLTCLRLPAVRRHFAWLGPAREELIAAPEAGSPALRKQDAWVGEAAVLGFWTVLAAGACLILSGPAFSALSLLVVASCAFVGSSEPAAAPGRFSLPLRPLLLVLFQTALLAVSPAHQLSVAAIVESGLVWIPIVIAGLAGWQVLVDWSGRGEALRPWTEVTRCVAAALAVLVLRTAWPVEGSLAATLLLTSLVWAVLSGAVSWQRRRQADGWWMLVWLAVAVLQSIAAGIVRLDTGLAPWGLLGAGVAFYALASRLPEEAGPRRPLWLTGLALPMLAGLVAASHLYGLLPAPTSHGVWWSVLPACAVSLFYFLAALREKERLLPALAASGWLSWALLQAMVTTGGGVELLLFAPGLSIVLLAYTLRQEMGPVWYPRLLAAGAACIYASPIVALSSQISWAWLAALLVLAVLFGSLAFVLKSRLLLVVSTAAMVVDLGFSVFQLGTTAPWLLWVCGLIFGLSIIGVAAWLESRREGVLQQLRVFRSEIAAWH